MNIVWNKVTWYSKLLALALFVALPFIGFYYGAEYGKAKEDVVRAPAEEAPAYYTDIASWQTYTQDNPGFSIAYPIDFEVSMGPFFDLTIPKAFEPQTNFDDAILNIDANEDTTAVAHCLAPDPNEGMLMATSTIIINGIPFVVFHSSDAAAGNRYDVTSYRTIHKDICYDIHYTIHSSQIGNYPPAYHLKPFDEQKVSSLLDRIAGTFKFTAN